MLLYIINNVKYFQYKNKFNNCGCIGSRYSGAVCLCFLKGGDGAFFIYAAFETHRDDRILCVQHIMSLGALVEWTNNIFTIKKVKYERSYLTTTQTHGLSRAEMIKPKAQCH